MEMLILKNAISSERERPKIILTRFTFLGPRLIIMRMFLIDYSNEEFLLEKSPIETKKKNVSLLFF